MQIRIHLTTAIWIPDPLDEINAVPESLWGGNNMDPDPLGEINGDPDPVDEINAGPESLGVKKYDSGFSLRN